MKKISIAFLFLLFGVALNAQDYKKVQTQFLLKKYEDAKTELDKMWSDAKVSGGAEGNLWRARINAVLFADTVTRAKYPNSGQVAMDAFKTYMTMEPDAKLLNAAG